MISATVQIPRNSEVLTAQVELNLLFMCVANHLSMSPRLVQEAISARPNNLNYRVNLLELKRCVAPAQVKRIQHNPP